MGAFVLQGSEISITEYTYWVLEKLQLDLHTTPDSVMVMVGADHGCTWWMVTGLNDGHSFDSYSLYVCDADNLSVEVLTHADSGTTVRVASVDYDERIDPPERGMNHG